MKDKLQRLIDSGKLKDAFELFKNGFINKHYRNEDSGHIYTHLLEAYIDAINSVNREESEELENVQKILEEIKIQEKMIHKNSAVEKIKKEIAETN
ncbi:MAG: hypothetical protein HY226_06695 [Candidatus Vogelbacteria bacterium]|nr:hypothetical protein [Candidatus Vogelbacteria bacterium]